MMVAAIPLRDPMLQVEPSWAVILAGVLFHQWADFSWAMVFFGLLGRWTSHLRPGTLLLIAVPWAVLTSASEWFFLVPVLPFWQPIFTLNQPYWVGLLVHLASASIYPLYPWLRDWVSGRLPSPHWRFATIWSGLAVAGVLVLSALAFLGWQNREFPHLGGKDAFDQTYMRRMAAHHAQGIELGLLAAERAHDPHLRALSRMMVANQKGEIAIFDQWWRSWFEGSLPPAVPEDHAGMPGMVSREERDRLRSAQAGDFDRLFVSMMSFHHQGAIAMADEAIREAGDLRLKLMSHAIRHSQRGEIELMHGSRGFAAVSAATSNLLRRAGEAPPDTLPTGHGQH
jgi:uncharacterized protein (DUF305 family)